MSEPFDAAREGGPFIEKGPPLEDLFAARPARPRRAQGEVEPTRRQARQKLASRRAGACEKTSPTGWPGSLRFRGLRRVARRWRRDPRPDEPRGRSTPGPAGGGFARKLAALAAELIAVTLLLTTIAALGQAPERESRSREKQRPQSSSRGQDPNPALGRRGAARVHGHHRPSGRSAPAPPRANGRNPGPNGGRHTLPPARSRPAPPPPPKPGPSPPGPGGVAPPRAPGPQTFAPPARRAPALPAPVPPGSPPEFL
jgi:hypothetical protein